MSAFRRMLLLSSSPTALIIPEITFIWRNAIKVWSREERVMRAPAAYEFSHRELVAMYQPTVPLGVVA